MDLFDWENWKVRQKLARSLSCQKTSIKMNNISIDLWRSVMAQAPLDLILCLFETIFDWLVFFKNTVAVTNPTKRNELSHQNIEYLALRILSLSLRKLQDKRLWKAERKHASKFRTFEHGKWLITSQKLKLQ